MKKVIVGLILFFIYLEGFSVVSIDRNYIIHSLKSSSTTNDVDFLTFTSAVAEFGKYLPEPYTDFNHFWVAKAGVFGEFFRYRDIFSITLFSDIELIASSNSIIFFDPRAFYWQEGIIFAYRYDWFNFQFSFTHRCKHDVDNADFVTLSRQVMARVIIWDSLWFRVFTEPIEIFNSGEVSFRVVPFVRNDFYVIAVDESVWYKVSPYESYSTRSEYKLNRVIDSFSVGFVGDLKLSENFGFYSKGYLWFDFLGDDYVFRWSRIVGVYTEHYLEFAFYIKGDGIRILFFIQNNSLREPAIEPYDQGWVNLFHIGIRAIDERFSF